MRPGGEGVDPSPVKEPQGGFRRYLPWHACDSGPGILAEVGCLARRLFVKSHSASALLSPTAKAHQLHIPHRNKRNYPSFSRNPLPRIENHRHLFGITRAWRSFRWLPRTRAAVFIVPCLACPQFAEGARRVHLMLRIPVPHLLCSRRHRSQQEDYQPLGCRLSAILLPMTGR